MEQIVTEFRTAITCIIKMIIEDIFLVLCIYSSYNQPIFYVNKIRERLFSAHNAGQIFCGRHYYSYMVWEISAYSFFDIHHDSIFTLYNSWYVAFHLFFHDSCSLEW